MTPDTPPTQSALKARGTAVLAAVVAAVVVWAIAGPVAGAALDVEMAGQDEPQHVGAGAVVFAALIAGLLGWGLLALLERFTGKAATVWTVIAAVFLLLSLTGPMSGTTSGTKAALVCMHLAVGGVLIALLGRSARQR
jgi:hypothetical protein